MKPTKIIDRFGLSPARRMLADKILANFNIPDKGVVIIFEQEDYTDDRITIWGHSAALHLSIKGGIEEMSPLHLLDLMGSDDYDQLIWLSKQACEADDMEFAWIFSHELRHLEQELSSNVLSMSTFFLSRMLGHVKTEEPIILNSIPAELDANLKAWSVTREVFGKELSDDYVEMGSVTGKHQKNFTLLKKYKPEVRYDVIRRTVELMKKYKSELKAIQGRSRNNVIKDFDLDSSLVELENGPQDI